MLGELVLMWCPRKLLDWYYPIRLPVQQKRDFPLCAEKFTVAIAVPQRGDGLAAAHPPDHITHLQLVHFHLACG